MCARAFTDEVRIKYTTQKGKVRFVSCCAHSARTGGKLQSLQRNMLQRTGEVCVCPPFWKVFDMFHLGNGTAFSLMFSRF